MTVSPAALGNIDGFSKMQRGSDGGLNVCGMNAKAMAGQGSIDSILAGGSISRRRDCHPAAPPSPFSRRFNRDGEGTAAE